MGTEQPVNSLPQVLSSLNYSCSFHYLLISLFLHHTLPTLRGWADLSWSLWCFQKLVLGIAHSKCLVINLFDRQVLRTCCMRACGGLWRHRPVPCPHGVRWVVTGEFGCIHPRTQPTFIELLLCRHRDDRVAPGQPLSVLSKCMVQCRRRTVMR